MPDIEGTYGFSRQNRFYGNRGMRGMLTSKSIYSLVCIVFFHFGQEIC